MTYTLKPEYRHKDAMWIMLDGMIWSSCAPASAVALAGALRVQVFGEVTVTQWPGSWEVHPGSPNTKFCLKYE